MFKELIKVCHSQSNYRRTEFFFGGGAREARKNRGTASSNSNIGLLPQLLKCVHNLTLNGKPWSTALQHITMENAVETWKQNLFYWLKMNFCLPKLNVKNVFWLVVTNQAVYTTACDRPVSNYQKSKLAKQVLCDTSPSLKTGKVMNLKSSKNRSYVHRSLVTFIVIEDLYVFDLAVWKCCWRKMLKRGRICFLDYAFEQTIYCNSVLGFMAVTQCCLLDKT